MSSNYFDNSLIDISGLCNVNRINLNTANNWTEIMVPGIAIVPKEKPCIENLNGVNGKVQILSKKLIDTPASAGANLEGKVVTGKKLIVEGLICLTFNYTGLEETQKVHSFHSSIPFSAYVVLPTGNYTNYVFNVVPCLEDLFIKNVCESEVCLTATLLIQVIPTPLKGGCPTDDIKPLTGNGCGCSHKPIIKDVKCSCEGHTDQHCHKESPNCCCNSNCLNDQIIVKGICPEEKIQKFLLDTVNGATVNNYTWVEFSVPEVLTIPCVKPDAEEILSVSSKVEIISQKIIETPEGANKEGFKITNRKLVIEGVLKQVIMYTAKNKEQSVHTAHFNVPFSVFIVLPKNTPFSTKYKVSTCIEDIYICLLNDRQFFKNVTLIIKATELYC